MRMDELERFIEQNRKDFDEVESFDKDLSWEELKKNQRGESITKTKIVLWFVVVLLGLLGAMYLNSIYGQNQSFETIAGLTETQEMQRDQMIQFVHQKEQKLKEKNIDISELGDFASELQGLDDIEQLIMGDFPETVNKEKLVKSMLQYYESKARVLELILLEIEKKEKNEIFEKEIY